jgi:hypothetical protein
MARKSQSASSRPRRPRRQPDQRGVPIRPRGKAASQAARTEEAAQPRTPWGRWARRREQKRQEREERRALRQRVRQLRWQRRRRITLRGVIFIGLLVLACGIAALVLILLGRPYPWEAMGDVTQALRLSRVLSERQARWETLAVEHYEVEIEYTDNAQTWCGPALIEIRDGRAVSLPSPDETHWFPRETCDQIVRQLLFDRAFGWLQGRLDEFRPGRTTITMTFDPEFGYPTGASAGVYDPADELPGCCWEARWQRMRPLYDD